MSTPPSRHRETPRRRLAGRAARSVRMGAPHGHADAGGTRATRASMSSGPSVSPAPATGARSSSRQRREAPRTRCPRSTSASTASVISEPERIRSAVRRWSPTRLPRVAEHGRDARSSITVVLADDTVLLRRGRCPTAGRRRLRGGRPVRERGGSAPPRRDAQPQVAVWISACPTHTDEGLRAAREIRSIPRHGSARAFSVRGVRVRDGFARRAPKASGTSSATGYPTSTSSHQPCDEWRKAALALDPAVVSEPRSASAGRSARRAHAARARPRADGRGGSNQAIADRMYVTLRAVEKHVTSIFSKIDLPKQHDDHRRVLAVLLFLRG